MQPFRYSKVHSVDEAINAASPVHVKYIGGGTNLLDLMKLDIETPPQLMDISTIGMDKIEILPNGGVLIGASVRNSDLAYHEYISRHYPVLSQALLSGASPQLRNMATVGGNLMQRTRCPYFYGSSFACNKRIPGSGCAAIPGYNRTNAILGVSDHCIATHPSDMCVALTALNAKIHLRSKDEIRIILARDFHVLPGSTPHIETVLKQGELITGVELAPMASSASSHYLKVRDRASYEFALASAAVVLDVLGGRIVNAQLAMGGIGTKPWHCKNAEMALTGNKVNSEVFLAAANAELKEATTFEHNAFKVELAKHTLVRALSTAGGIYE